MVDGVVCRVGRPACSEAVDDGAKGEDAAHLGDAHAHGDVDEVAAVAEDADDDEEDDEGRDPRPELVDVHDLVAEDGDEEGAHGDDDDACEAWHVAVDRVDELRADDAVDCGPAETGEDVEEGDQLDAVPAVPEAGENHLTQTEDGAQAGEVAYWGDADQVEEQDDENRVDESEEEERLAEDTNGEGTDDHVGREPLIMRR